MASVVAIFKSGSVAQFLIHGNIFDVVGVEDAGTRRLLSLKAFLKDVMFASYDVVLEYDREDRSECTDD